jgi:ubiquinone/menaquinone biosynthesis C-methylase UbiE
LHFLGDVAVMKWRKLQRYSKLQSWAYDRFLAPAVAQFGSSVFDSMVQLLPQGARVLDVGCGGGQLAVVLAERRQDLLITGIDLSPEQVARAVRRSRSTGRSVRFSEGDAMQLPFCKETFDFVYSVASLKHWPDELRGLLECCRVLAPEGRLIVVEADRGCRLEDAYAFVSCFRIPRLFRPVLLLYFRTFVAGQSIDLDEGREFLRNLGLENTEIERTKDLPGLIMSGRKPGAPTPTRTVNEVTP